VVLRASNVPSLVVAAAPRLGASGVDQQQHALRDGGWIL